MANTQEELESAWALILRARAGLIGRGDTPGVWTERIPEPDEIHELYRILTKRLPVGEAVSKLIAAIHDGDKERGRPWFKDTSPKTMQDLEIIQRMETTE